MIRRAALANQGGYRREENPTNEEVVAKVSGARTSRRKIVTTGTKLAYAAPLVAASFKLSALTASATEWVWMTVITLEEQGYVIGDSPPCKVVICHATCSESGGNTHVGFSAIEIPSHCEGTPEQALEAHLESPGHQNGRQDDRQDVFPLNVTDDKKLAQCPGVSGVSPE